MIGESGARYHSPVPRARRYPDARVNLSSNELIHASLADLTAPVYKAFNATTTPHYPVVGPTVEMVGRHFRRHPDEIILTAGSDAMIRALVAELGQRSSRTLVLQAPNYEAWSESATRYGWSIRGVEDGQRTDATALLDAARDTSARCVVAISLPNGPAGHTMTMGQVIELRRVCQEHGHLLIVDACYSGFCLDPLQVVGLADSSCLVIMSFSKMFGMAGARVSVTFGDAELIAFMRLSRIEDHVNITSLDLVENAIANWNGFRLIWADIADVREKTRADFLDRGYDVPPSGGNFLHIRLHEGSRASALTGRLSARGYRVRNMVAVPSLVGNVRFTVTDAAVMDRFKSVLENEMEGLR